MAKLTLTDFASLANETSFITTLNNNFADIETAIENTLSRDGTSPNTMSADLDLNSNDLNNVGTLNAAAILLDGAEIPSATDITTTYANMLTALTGAQAAQTAAEAAQTAAEAAAAGVNLPTIGVGDDNKVLQVNDAEDGYELHEPTSTATANALIRRDNNGRAKVADPSASGDIATKNYVDSVELSTSNIADDAVTAAKLDLANLGVPVLLSSTNISAADSVDLAIAFSSNTGYNYFKVVVDGCVPTGAAVIGLRVSIDGSTFENGAGNYQWFYTEQDSVAGTSTDNNSTSANQISVSQTLTTTQYSQIVLRFVNPHSTSVRCPIGFEALTVDGTTGCSRVTGVGYYEVGNDDLTGFQVFVVGAETFTATGTVKVYGSTVPF